MVTISGRKTQNDQVSHHYDKHQRLVKTTAKRERVEEIKVTIPKSLGDFR